MKKNKEVFLAIGVAIMVTASSLVMGFANPNQQNGFIGQGPIPEKGHPRPLLGPGLMGNPKLLALLQVDESTLRTERESGKTLAVIANEHGVSEQELKNLLIEEKTQRVDEDVKEGRISSDQAQRIKADIEEHVSREMNDPGPMLGKVRPISGPPILEPDPLNEQK